MTSTGIVSLPEELLVDILSHVLVPQHEMHFSKKKHHEMFREAKRLLIVSKHFHRLVEPLAYRTLRFTDESASDQHGTSLYVYQSVEELRAAPVPVPQFNLLRENMALAQHIRHFRCIWVDMPHAGIIGTLQGATFRDYVRKTYSEGFCRFLDGLLGGITQPGKFQEAFGRSCGIGFDLLVIFALTLAYNVEVVALSITRKHKGSPLDRFFAFCDAQGRAASMADTTGDTGRLRAPLSKLRMLELHDEYGGYRLSDEHLSSLMSFHGLESCKASCTSLEQRPAPTPENGVDGDDNNDDATLGPTLRHLELLETELVCRGGSACLAHILQTYPNLETLTLETVPFDADIGDDEEPAYDGSPATSYDGFGHVLRMRGRRLRRFELGPRYLRDSGYPDDEDSGTIGCLRDHLVQLEYLKLPAARLASIPELTTATVPGHVAIAEPDLADFLPASLRYLWVDFPFTEFAERRRVFKVYAEAFFAMLRNAADKMPQLEWVLAEVMFGNGKDESPSEYVDVVPPGWTEEKIGSHHHLFRRARQGAGGTWDGPANVLTSRGNPEAWEDVVLRRFIDER
ncbi:F-box-like domain-containing protein [Microdochium nivale]|nr:F-box-like domain-containing protein [Microdochium nivale]